MNMASQFINDEREREREGEREDHENWLSSIFFVLWCVFLMLPVRVSMYLLLWFRNPGHWWTSFLHATTLLLLPLLLSALPSSSLSARLHLRTLNRCMSGGDFVGPNACMDSKTELVFSVTHWCVCSQWVRESVWLLRKRE
jgi:small-conductance mechanosensitive channel